MVLFVLLFYHGAEFDPLKGSTDLMTWHLLALLLQIKASRCELVMCWITESHISIHVSIHRLTDLTLQVLRSENTMYHFLAFPLFSTQYMKITLPVLPYSHNLCPITLAKQAHSFFCWHVVVVHMLCLRAGLFVLTGSARGWMTLYRMWRDMAALYTANLLCLKSLYSRKLILMYYLTYSGL